MRKIKLWWRKLLCSVLGHRADTTKPIVYLNGTYSIYCKRCKKYVLTNYSHK